MDAHQSEFVTYFCNLFKNMAKNDKKMKFYTKNQFKSIYEVKNPSNHLENPFKRFLVQF